MKISKKEILKNKDKYKNKCLKIGMLVIGIEDLLEHPNWFKQNDLFEVV